MCTLLANGKTRYIFYCKWYNGFLIFCICAYIVCFKLRIILVSDIIFDTNSIV